MGKIRLYVRCWWLWVVERLKDSAAQCKYCGKWGASETSLAHLDRLCKSCATEVCIAAEQEVPCFDTFPGPPPTYRGW